MSHDTRLRQSIRKLVRLNQNYRQFRNCTDGTRNTKWVIKVTRENRDLMLKEIGVQALLSDEDVKQYLKEVFTE